jgi:hypothetical protein
MAAIPVYEWMHLHKPMVQSRRDLIDLHGARR